MSVRHTMPRRLTAAALALLTLGAGAPAQANDFPSEAQPSRTIFVPQDKSLSFRLDGPASKIVVAQPDTAQIVATTNSSFYVRGKARGATNLLVYGAGGRLQEVIDVQVGYDARALEAELATALPGEQIKVQTLGQGLLLTGDVSTTSVAARAKTLADKFAPDGVTSTLTVRASQEVVLQVRVLEASRSALQDLGFSANITSGTTNLVFGSGLVGASPPAGGIRVRSGIGDANASVEATIVALEEKGLIRTLARPNLVALSGEKASFLAGGEFPYPVPQGRDQISLQFREYGVRLNFQPLVQDNGLIRLLVEPEVSELDATNALRINDITVPGLITRKASTTVELKNNDSLAIGGLFQHNYANAVRQFPGLGSLPVVGALFRSTRWRRNETELVIIVTPRLVTAEDFATAARTTSVSGEPSAVDLILNGRAFDTPLPRDPGDAR
ncbi:type II and III secretion system protein family protein [Phenylobacterium deserti]|uniref:Type II and III secretion system protein family protein n=1 Tax=Phenylobacterium deserti TaxID=1914756 RepID=A0A328ARN4_9CAUL|nr:type II and III secretion system protein family protein [Phenylobacterium deserti]RAK56911.1 type II and III secretion system protein family protein [Phenylobacterium deserti]